MRRYYTPAAHPRLGASERADIAEVLLPQAKQSVSGIGLFRFPLVGGLAFAKLLSDAAWYFYLFWLPKYLYDVRNFDTKQVGYFAWIPYAAAGIDRDRKSTRLNSSHANISYAVFCLKKKKTI